MGVDSQGVKRVIEEVEHVVSGYMNATGRPSLKRNDKGAWIVDGHGGFGMPALQLGMERQLEKQKKKEFLLWLCYIAVIQDVWEHLRKREQKQAV